MKKRHKGISPIILQMFGIFFLVGAATVMYNFVVPADASRTNSYTEWRRTVVLIGGSLAMSGGCFVLARKRKKQMKGEKDASGDDSEG